MIVVLAFVLAAFLYGPGGTIDVIGVCLVNTQIAAPKYATGGASLRAQDAAP